MSDEEIEETTTVDDVEDEEEVEEPDPENDPISYFGFGAVALWGAVLGFLIRNKYTGIPESNAFWKGQCPATALTGAGIATALGANTVLCGATPKDTCPPMVMWAV